MINKVHREFVERTECNRNVLVFSLASAAVDGVIEYDRNGNTPTITRIDVEGRNYYQIDNCVLIDSIRLWDDTALVWKELSPLTQFEIDQKDSLLSTAKYPYGYQQLDSPDTFQILPALKTSEYEYKFEVRYREGFRDLITFDGSPTDSSVIQTTGIGLSDFTTAVTAIRIPVKFKIEISHSGLPAPDTVDTFKDIYDSNGWVPIHVDENLTGAAQDLAYGATYTATATTGHTDGNVFEIAVDDYLTTLCPDQFKHVFINGICGELLRLERDPEYQSYLAQYERDTERVKRKMRRVNADQSSNIRNDYTGGGG